MQKRTKRGPSRRLAVAALTLPAFVLGACENIMEVELPGNMTEPDLYAPGAANTLVNSVIADFACSYSYFSTMTGSMEDTWIRATGYWGGWAEYQTNRPGGGECATDDTSTGWGTGFQKSRMLAEKAYDLLGEWGSEVSNGTQLAATAATYAGLVYQVFGETYCELTVDGGPIMKAVDGGVANGVYQNNQVLTEAEGWFNRALTTMGGSDYSIVSTTSLKQLALLGRARVRLATGNLAGAAEDAAQIQPGFVAYATRDASVRTRWNSTYRTFDGQGYAAVAPVFFDVNNQPIQFTGYRNLTISSNGLQTVRDGVADPRVPVDSIGQFLQDGITDSWAQRKYDGLDADVPIGRWAEAQLILAEVAAATNPVNAVQYINAVRGVHNLPNYAGPTDAATIRSVIIEEKRREFFFEGRFLAEKHRKELWFPRGAGFAHKAMPYGNATCFVMPLSEYQNNANVPFGYEGPVNRL